jgi:predicted alpha/beta superfamily hydrolase
MKWRKPAGMVFIQAFLIGTVFNSCTQPASQQKPEKLPKQEIRTIDGTRGVLKRHQDFKSSFVNTRTVDVLLPPSYAGNPGKRYPVVYMHDGQNLFIPKLSYSGVDWGVDEVLYGTGSGGQLPEAIIVGIWNTRLRELEYNADKAKLITATPEERHYFETGKRHAMGDRYLKFLVTELKPYIDKTYRTKTGRDHTSICGSSMGGVISLYALCEYPEVFGRAGCVSTHWPVLKDALISYMEFNLPAAGNHRIWFDHGTGTLDAGYAPFQMQADRVMAGKGYLPEKDWITRVYAGEDHSERAWRRRIGEVLAFLLKP